MGITGKTFIVTTLAAFALVGCKSSDVTRRHAVAEVSPTQGQSARGTVEFIETRNGIRVVAHITGLTPGLHGFHVHEKGDCSAPDAASAGPHFNPAGAPHAGPDAPARHIGDLGNITANASGVGHYERVDKHLSFDGPNSILNRALIVHASPDDLTGQPAGNAGARIACGVIRTK
ncbi:MAG TPA: superoxide dismutase family protein [Candidatus Acidoferrum sp.]|nr:superoxide dismutase family protein [Candidatus Acidoferrum sp.]